MYCYLYFYPWEDFRENKKLEVGGRIRKRGKRRERWRDGDDDVLLLSSNHRTHKQGLA